MQKAYYYRMRKEQVKSPKKVLKVVLIILLIGILASSIALFSVFISTKPNKAKYVKQNAAVEIYSAAGTKLATPMSIDNYVPYADIDADIVNAFVALEDKRFFSHKGLDYIRIAGATFKNIGAGKIVEGGSTITQQLAKNSQLSLEKTISRKLKEAKIAVALEKQYSKEQILEMYLNTIYFGNSIYGIKNACRKYFDKDTKDILPYEAALLAGTVNNPKKNSPLRNPENADKRKNLVLRLMYEQNFIDKSTYESNLERNYAQPKQRQGDPFDAYFDTVIEEAASILGISEKTIIQGKYKIHTYLDEYLQRNVYNDYFLSEDFRAKANDGNDSDFSALITDNATSGVIAYVSTHNYSPLELRRQPGSTIKPVLVYAPALNGGYLTTNTPILDEKTDFGGYSPENYRNSYKGWISAKDALATSSNVAAVMILDKIGVDYVRNYAYAMGWELSDGGMSVALGGLTEGATLREMTGCYQCLANEGTYSAPTFIKSITLEGETIYTHNSTNTRVFSEETAYLTTDMLIAAAKYGTASRLGDFPFPIASKTGTVGQGQYNTDCYNFSYTTRNTVSVWYGNLSGKSECDIAATGGSYPTLMARRIHMTLHPPIDDFSVPDGIVELPLDVIALKELHTELLATPNTPQKYVQYCLYDEKHSPEAFSELFEMGTAPDIAMSDGNITMKLNTDNFFSYKIKLSDESLNPISETADLLPGEGEKVLTLPLNAECHLVFVTVETYYGGSLIKSYDTVVFNDLLFE